jgi:putative endonuclease
MLKYTVYLLYSDIHSRTYIGQTSNLEKRLERHNKGFVISTRLFKPWRIIYSEEFASRSEAIRREKWFKTGSGRTQIQSKLVELGIASA